MPLLLLLFLLRLLCCVTYTKIYLQRVYLNRKMAHSDKALGTDNGRSCQCERKHITASLTRRQHIWEPDRFFQNSQTIWNLPGSGEALEHPFSCDSLLDSWREREREKKKYQRISLIREGRERKAGRKIRKKREGLLEFLNMEKNGYFQAPSFPPYPSPYHVTNAWSGSQHGYEFYPSPPPDHGTTMYPPEKEISAFACPYYAETKGGYKTD